MFCKEVVTWKTLRHPNIVPFLGAMMDGTQFIAVSPWMDNGSINEFTKTHPEANRFELVGFYFYG
jgi:serine/threonine protein kinase